MTWNSLVEERRVAGPVEKEGLGPVPGVELSR